MSEPLSAHEIEDVLSSIRRLVSEDLRPAPRAPAPVMAPAAPVSRVETARPALILTPALRVVPDAEPARPAPDAMALQDVVATVGAAVQNDRQDWEPETGDLDAAAEPAWADAAWDEPAGEDRAPGALAGAEGIVEAVAEVEAVAGAEQIAGAEAFAEAQEIVEAEEVVEAEEIVRTGADLPEAEVVSQAGPAEDDEWLAAAEAEVIASLQEDEAEADHDVLQPDVEMTFDEEVLRDLVRDLIREELQGHLGERITRNIRKLVRAEIARALAAAEFD